MDLGTSFKRRMCGRIKRYPHVNLWRRWGFSVQCFSISPMHGMAFLDSSFERIRDCIIRALHFISSSSVCSALSQFHQLASIELSRTERFTLAEYC